MCLEEHSMSQSNRRQFVMQAGAFASSLRAGLAASDRSYSQEFPDMLLLHRAMGPTA
jgi:hypothetical protein